MLCGQGGSGPRSQTTEARTTLPAHSRLWTVRDRSWQMGPVQRFHWCAGGAAGTDVAR